MQYIEDEDDIGNMDNLFSKIIKIASILDANGFYKESDALENHLNKIAGLTTLPEGVAQLPKAGKGIWDIIKNIPKIKAPVLPKLPFKPAPTSPSRPGRTTVPDLREWPTVIWDTPPLEVAPPLEPETIRPLPPVLSPEFPVAIPETPTDPFAPVRPGTIDLPDTGPIIRPEPDLIPRPRPSDRTSPVPLPLPGNNPIPLPGGKPNPTPLPGGKPNPTPLPPGSPTPTPPGQKPPTPPKPPKPPKPPTKFPKPPFILPPILIPGNQLPGGELYYESGSSSSRDT